MNGNEPILLTRDVEASVIPIGTKVTLQKGEQATITQSLGGSYTVVVNGNMFRIEGQDADALGMEVVQKKTGTASGPVTQEQVEKEIWNQLKTCYDPEIPVNIYELGLIYAIDIEPAGSVKVEMTLTAPACPSAQELPEQVRDAVLAVPGVTACEVDVVWDPPWDQSRMSEDARLALNMF